VDNPRVLPDVQVAVVGGGPAGARAAELLARAGAEVLLLESGGPDVENLCSGLLNREGQMALGLNTGGLYIARRGCRCWYLPQAVRRSLMPRLGCSIWITASAGAMTATSTWIAPVRPVAA
jgi:choline dehydrogenase-like flavoprotein